MTEPERFLVTGASGAVGAWVVKLLLAQGVAVVALGDSSDDRRLRLIATPGELTRVHRVQGDVADLESLRAGMAGASHVVHLDTASVEISGQPPDRTAEEFAIGTENVFATAEAMGITGVAFESSMSVYSPSDSPLPVNAALEPFTVSGAVHRVNEAIAERYRSSRSVSIVGLRLGLVYGPGQDQGGLAMTTVAIAAAVERKPFHVPYDGMADFQFVRDVGAAFIGAARAAPQSTGIINLRGEPCAIGDFVRAVATLTGADDLTAAGAAFLLPVAKFDPAASEVLGAQPATSVFEGIRETLETFRWSPRDLYRSA